MKRLLEPTNASPAMDATYYIPGRWNPTHSLLGRAVRRLTVDARQAEAWFIVAVVGVAIGLVLVHGAPGIGPWLSAGGRLASVVLGGAVCLLGYEPPIRVIRRADQIEILRGRRVLRLPYARIREVEAVPALRFHRHYRRYAAARVFVNRIPERALVLHTTAGPVVLGLGDAHRRDLEAFLAGRRRTIRGQEHDAPSMTGVG